MHGFEHAACSTHNAHWVTAEDFPQGKWIQLDWPTPVTIGRISFDTVNANVADCIGSNTGRCLGGGTIQWWDGNAWVTAGTVSGQSDDWEFTFPAPVVTDSIRLYDLVASTVGGQTSNPVIIEWQAFCM